MVNNTGYVEISNIAVVIINNVVLSNVAKQVELFIWNLVKFL